MDRLIKLPWAQVCGYVAGLAGVSPGSGRYRLTSYLSGQGWCESLSDSVSWCTFPAAMLRASRAAAPAACCSPAALALRRAALTAQRSGAPHLPACLMRGDGACPGLRVALPSCPCSWHCCAPSRLPLPARPPLQELLEQPDMQTVLTCGAMSKASQPGAANAIDPDHLVGLSADPAKYKRSCSGKAAPPPAWPVVARLWHARGGMHAAANSGHALPLEPLPHAAHPSPELLPAPLSAGPKPAQTCPCPPPSAWPQPAQIWPPTPFLGAVPVAAAPGPHPRPAVPVEPTGARVPHPHGGGHGRVRAPVHRARRLHLGCAPPCLPACLALPAARMRLPPCVCLQLV